MYDPERNAKKPHLTYHDGHWGMSGGVAGDVYSVAAIKWMCIIQPFLGRLGTDRLQGMWDLPTYIREQLHDPLRVSM